MAQCRLALRPSRFTGLPQGVLAGFALDRDRRFRFGDAYATPGEVASRAFRLDDGPLRLASSDALGRPASVVRGSRPAEVLGEVKLPLPVLISAGTSRPSGASLDETHGAGEALGVVLLRPQA